MSLGMELGLGPGDIVLDADPDPPPRGTAPNLRQVSIVAKRSPISTTAEHLLFLGCRVAFNGYTIRLHFDAARFRPSRHHADHANCTKPNSPP